jgi:glycosyltransferase involved in cell wall biosynthesis
MVSLEAIACGRPALCYVSSDYPENKDFPLKDLRAEEEIAESIANLPSDLWEREHEYLERHHDVDAVVSRLESIYQGLL